MAMDSFLLLSNGVLGESEDAVYEKGIDVLSWSWGLSNAGTTHMASGGGGGKANIQDLSLTKYVDLSSNELIKRCSNGSHFDKARLVVRKAGGEAPVEYYSINMEMVMVTSYQTSGMSDGSDRMTESLTLNMRRFEIVYKLQEVDGASGTEAMATWDAARNVEWDGAPGGEWKVGSGGW